MCSPCWPGSGGNSSHALGSHAQSSCTPPHSKHKTHLQTGGKAQRHQWCPGHGNSRGQEGQGHTLTSDHLHVEPQSPQGLLCIEIAFHQLIKRLGRSHTDFPPDRLTRPTQPQSNSQSCSHHHPVQGHGGGGAGVVNLPPRVRMSGVVHNTGVGMGAFTPPSEMRTSGGHSHHPRGRDVSGCSNHPQE